VPTLAVEYFKLQAVDAFTSTCANSKFTIMKFDTA